MFAITLSAGSENEEVNLVSRIMKTKIQSRFKESRKEKVVF